MSKLLIGFAFIVELANEQAKNSQYTVFNGVLLKEIYSLMKGGELFLATKEQRQNKRFVEKLLQIKGIDYDDWVDEIHTEFIQNNNDLILQGLKLLTKQEQKHEEKEEKREEKAKEIQQQSFSSVPSDFQK